MIARKRVNVESRIEKKEDLKLGFEDEQVLMERGESGRRRS